MALIPSENKNHTDIYNYAKSMVDFRSELTEQGKFRNSLTGEWYKTCEGCEGSEIEKNKETLITTFSHIFRIDCTATMEEERLTITSVVKR